MRLGKVGESTSVVYDDNTPANFTIADLRNFCAAAGVRDAEFGPDSETVRHVLADQFGRGGKGIKDVARAQNGSHEAAVAVETRIQALVSRVAGN